MNSKAFPPINTRLITLIFAIGANLLSACQQLPSGSQAAAETLVLVSFTSADTATAGGKRGLRRRYSRTDLWPTPAGLRKDIQAIAGTYGISRVDAWPIEALGLYCVVYEVKGERDVSALIDELLGDQRIADAQRMQMFEALGVPASIAEAKLARRNAAIPAYNDPKFTLQYGVNAEILQKLHQFTRGAKTKIAIIDSIVDADHPDLRGQITRIHDFTNAPGQRPGAQQHGTAVAGVIAAAANNAEGLVGLAPDATVYNYGACVRQDERTRCNSFALAKALQHALNDEVDIINMSFAGPYDRLLQSLLDVATGSGIMLFAAHNPRIVHDNTYKISHNSANNFPAGLANVISVDAKRMQLWFASEEQLSTQAGGGYRYYYGNSVATAGTSGIASLLRSILPAEQATVIIGNLLNCRDITQDANESFMAVLQSSVQCESTGQSTNSISGHDHPLNKSDELHF